MFKLTTLGLTAVARQANDRRVWKETLRQIIQNVDADRRATEETQLP